MSTIFSIKDPNPGIWFKFNEDDPESGEIKIRVLNSAQRNKVQKTCVKNKTEYKHGQRFEYTETKDDKFSEMLWDYSIVEWNSLEDDEGSTIECTTENKVFLMQNNVGFAQFVSQCMEMLSEDEENRIAMVTENLSPGRKELKKSRPAKDAKN